ncbi:MAG: hypothetical protein M3373_11355 [Gemmatimonadota bacterium]|nr:hypothetical protein [Gemmatimonadota bacterium]
MTARQLGLVTVVIVLGALQAWDSDILQAPPGPIALGVVGTLAPALGLLSPDGRLRIASLVVSVLALTAARIISPVTHNGLTLVTFFGAMIVFFDSIRMKRPV